MTQTENTCAVFDLATNRIVARGLDEDAALRLQDENPDYNVRYCEGHYPSEFDPMGETAYCDGTCRRWG